MEDQQPAQEQEQEQPPQEITCSGGLKLNLGATLARYPHLPVPQRDGEGGNGAR